MRGYAKLASDIAENNRDSRGQLEELKGKTGERSDGHSETQELQQSLLRLVAKQAALLEEVATYVSAQDQEASALRDVLRRLRPSRAAIG